MTVMFVSHGSPMLALETGDAAAALRGFGASLARPSAVVIVSAHWETSGPLRVTASARPETIHDFRGFPEALYDLRYPAPGDPALAREVARLVGGVEDPDRGLDHGAWIPLLHLLPASDLPVLQLSLPAPSDPERILAAGRALAPLRDRGVILIGSGGVVHNLRKLDWRRRDAPVAPWAQRFDDWVRGRLQDRDAAALREHRTLSPDSRLAVPTTEHYDPIFFALGAAGPEDRIEDVHAGISHASGSMRCVAFRRPRL